MEKLVERKKVYEGKIIDVIKDKILVDGTQESIRELVVHPGGVCMALKTSDQKYLLVRQFRYAQSQEMLEFPAGRLEYKEEPLVGIKREIQEETGYSAHQITYMGKTVPTGGYLTEVIHLYHGYALSYVGQHLDEDERISVEAYTLDEIIKMILNHEITDAKTIVLAFKIQAIQDTL